MNTAPNVVASSLDALAAQLRQLVNRPSQQAPAQTAALADRVTALGVQMRGVDFRRGVRLGQVAEALRGRAVARVYLPLPAEELNTLVEMLEAAAEIARAAGRRTVVHHQHGGDAA
ncbi:hypothetical protein J2847_005122 [Azospirillum agricola]|uniref:hypothetical protein n=1 Tax=Azospirillum agricola TaxID=1720247 RepID=UPI001AE9636C|nr:hypothetical protein [Azospirillum agricola]MBP2231803.1 hypothetical protein [Azospirillum agricola]